MDFFPRVSIDQLPTAKFIASAELVIPALDLSGTVRPKPARAASQRRSRGRLPYRSTRWGWTAREFPAASAVTVES